MSIGEVTVTIVLGVVSIEVSDVAGWLARKVAPWAAKLRYRGQPERAAVRAQEWLSVIEERPGNVLKLGTALWFARGAVLTRSAMAMRRNRNRAVPFFGPVPSESLGLSCLGPAVGVWLGRDSVALGVVMGIGACVGAVAIYVLVRNNVLRHLLPALAADNVLSADEADAVLAWFPTQFWRIAVRWKASREVRWSVCVMKRALLSAAADDAAVRGLAKARPKRRDDPAVISAHERAGQQREEKVAVARRCLGEIEALTRRDGSRGPFGGQADRQMSA